MRGEFDKWFEDNMDELIDSGRPFRDSLFQAFERGVLFATRPVNGNARLAGFGAPAAIVEPKRKHLPAPTTLDNMEIKHWNIWDTTKSQFSQVGMDKQTAFYWADRYNKIERRGNIYIPIPVIRD